MRPNESLQPQAAQAIKKRRLPFFGVASVLAPLAGGITYLFFCISSVTGNEPAEVKLGYWMQVMGIFLLAIIGGLIFACIAVIRQERRLWLAYVGIFLSSSPFILGVIITIIKGIVDAWNHTTFVGH